MKCTFFPPNRPHCLCLLAGMAKLHPEECRPSLYRVGQWGQVGDTTYSLISSLFAISHFPVSPVLHHFMEPSLNLFGSGERVARYDSGLGKKKKINERLGGGWSGAWENEGGLSLSSSLRSISAPPSGIWGRGERLGRRWEGFWSLVSLWHMGNGSWVPPVLLSVFVFLVYLPVVIFVVCLFFFLSLFSIYPHI